MFERMTEKVVNDRKKENSELEKLSYRSYL